VLPPPTPLLGSLGCPKRKFAPSFSPYRRGSVKGRPLTSELQSSKYFTQLSAVFQEFEEIQIQGIERSLQNGCFCNYGLVLAGGPDGRHHRRNEGNRTSCSCVSGGMRGRYNFDTGVHPLLLLQTPTKTNNGASSN